MGALALALALLQPVLAAAAAHPPGLRFHTISAGRVRVTYHDPLEPLAREAAAIAEQVLRGYETRYGARIRHLELVVTDTDDSPNGFASPLPYPLVQVRAVAPDGTDEFGTYESWLRLVLTHELAHTIHLEEAHGILGFGRKVLGRAPYLFPNALSPSWLIEGLATAEETQGTAYGRGRSPEVDMVVRMAALEGRFPAIDQPVAGLDAWPGGQAAYFFGEAFLSDLVAERGTGVLPELSRVHSGRLIPFLDDLTADKVTGGSYTTRWKAWQQRVSTRAREEQEAIGARGITPSRALTTRGVRQTGPRIGPDGTWIAYTSRTLDRPREIRLVRADGTGDRRLVERNGGEGLAWTPDGRSIVFDEPDVFRLFARHSDLRIVDVATGRVRWLARGLRAQDPDIAPDGRTVVFVRQRGDRSDLAAIGLDGRGLRDITRSGPGEQWGHPRVSPDGRRIAASRYQPGGRVDLVLVDLEGGATTPLTNDRARDAEPDWTPDGAHLVFRSDRDGVLNLYALRLADGAILRVTNLVGGASLPSVAPDGRTLAFASYSARGYDIHTLDLDLAPAPPAEPYRDPYGEPIAPVVPADGPVRPYRAFSTLLPRFWSPYVEHGDEWRVGIASGGADPLFHHAWAAALHQGVDTGALGYDGVYVWDRFFPTVLLGVKDDRSPLPVGSDRTRELDLRVSVPIARTLRGSEAVDVAYRRSREERVGTAEPDSLDLGGVEIGLRLDTSRRQPYSISPADGLRLRVAALREDTGLGSDVDLWKVTTDARVYQRLGDESVLALRVGTGATLGRPQFTRSFTIGGFADSSLLDVVRANLAVLRGYPDDAFTGRSLAYANAELRLPLGHPQRGWRTAPLFLRHLHATAFADAASVWSDDFRISEVKTAAGAALGADLNAFQGLPVTLSAGVARGFNERGETRAYLRLGLAF